MFTRVSVIVILRGQLNTAYRSRTRILKVSVIVILRGHLNLNTLKGNTEPKVSVIVILRGHLNMNAYLEFKEEKCLSDRNPTWPLEPCRLCSRQCEEWSQ